MHIYLKFSCKWTLDFDDRYVFIDKYNFMVNTQTGKILKQVIKGGSIGYIINGKFYTLTKLKSSLTKIKKNECPF